MRRLLLAAFLVACPALAVVAALQRGRDRDLREMLLRAKDADRVVSYRCTRVMTWEGKTIRTQVLHRAPDETRVVHVEGGRHDHDRDHDRDHGHRGGGPRMRGARMHGPWGGFPVLDVDLALRNYDVHVEGDTVRFTPRYAGRNSLTLHIDAASGLATGWELLDPSGKTLLSVSTDEETLDTHPTFTADDFPANVDREWRGPRREHDRDEAKEPVRVLLPRALPEGFQPLAQRHGLRPHEGARRFWTDGIAMISLMEFHARPGEGPADANGQVTVERHPCEGKGMLTGRVGETAFVVMGSVAEKELLDIISSFEEGAPERTAE